MFVITENIFKHPV